MEIWYNIYIKNIIKQGLPEGVKCMENLKNTNQGYQAQDSARVSGNTRVKKNRYRGWFYFALILILSILVLGVLDKFGFFTTPAERETQKVEQFLEETGPWYAVFLTNGQVYFGKLENLESQYPLLRDIYYLQIQQVQAPQQVDSNQQNEDGQSRVVPAPKPLSPRLTLIKFGTELHKPKDYMRINRDNILLWQELSSDSEVVKAIAKYKEENEKQEKENK